MTTTVNFSVQVAKDLGPGHTIVTCLCDSGQVSVLLPSSLYSQTSIIQTSIIQWGFHLHFHLVRIALVKIQTSCCSILLFLVLLPGAMASIKHNRVDRTT